MEFLGNKEELLQYLSEELTSDQTYYVKVVKAENHIEATDEVPKGVFVGDGIVIGDSINIR